MGFASTRAAVIGLLVTFAVPALADVPADRIFDSSFGAALSIEGSVGYPTALANAAVELHFGTAVNAARTDANGHYIVAVELADLSPDAIVELVAGGVGAQSQIVWASPLGPADRLLSLAGSGNRITAAMEPFVNLNPRTTVAAAAIRAAHGGVPVDTAAAFYRAARSRQPLTDRLVIGLALIARGDLALPADATDTFAAVTGFTTAQELYADVTTASQVQYPCTPAASPYCIVSTTLPTDPGIVPAVALADGVVHSGTDTFGSVSFTTWAFHPNGATVEVIGPAPMPIVADASIDADGATRLTRSGGAPFLAYEDFVYDPVSMMQIDEHVELTAIRLRQTPGPGGQTEYAEADDYEYTYPNNPEYPPVSQPGVMPLPQLDAGAPLPAALLPAVPSIANRTWVLPTPLPSTNADSTGAAYDVQAFATASGAAERSARTFSFAQGAGQDAFSVDYGDVQAQVHFVVEVEPGVWRVQLHTNSAASQSLIDGLMLAPDPGAAWTPADVPGTDLTDLNSSGCAGPYGGIDYPANPNSVCAPFGYVFGSDQSVQQYADPPYAFGTWSIGSAAQDHWLLFGNTSGTRKKGWQLVTPVGASSWILENLSYSPNASPAPPVVFEPTDRLVRLKHL